MKIKLTIILVAFAMFAKSQTKEITGFMGLPFGARSSVVIDSLKKRGDLMDNFMAKAGIYNFKNIYFAGRKTYFTSVAFKDDGLYMGSIFFSIESKPKVIDTFNEISKTITEKYGEPYKKIREFKYPYNDGQDDSWIAVRDGYASIMDFWEINNNQINLAISTKGDNIILIYRDGLVYEKVKNDGKSKSDY